MRDHAKWSKPVREVVTGLPRASRTRTAGFPATIVPIAVTGTRAFFPAATILDRSDAGAVNTSS
jgi:hypothetical protein